MIARLSTAVLCLGASLFSLVVATTSAAAQSTANPDAPAANAAAAPESGEIIVTAQRRAESLYKVPIAITALSQEMLTQRGITQTSGLSGMVPSLQVNSPFGDTQPNFTLRGIGVGNEYTANQASPVGVYTDDAYLAARAAHGMQIFDLARVEVLRGPQGTLYGRNTTGGAINFISNKPTLTGSKGYFDFGYGNFNAVTAQAAVETTLSEGVAGLRVAVNYAKADGYVVNRFPGEPNANSTDTFAARAILRVKPSDKLDITLKLTGSRANPTQAAVIDIGLGPNDTNLVQNYSRINRGLGFWEVEHPRMGSSPTTGFGGALTVNYEFSDELSLTSLTSYDYVKQTLSQEGSGTRPGNFQQLIDTQYGNTFNMWNQELRFNYSHGGTTAQGGIYIGYDRDHNHSNAWLFDGALMLDYQYYQTRKSYAAFTQIDQKLGSRFGLTLGLRYTLDRSKYDGFHAYAAPGSSYTGERDTSIFNPATGFFLHGGYDAAAGKIVTEPALRLSNNALTGRAAINYSLDGGGLLYASYGRGYRAGAFCGGCVTTPTVEVAKPESIDSFEIGAKGRFFDNALTASAAVFLMNYKNQQLDEIIGVDTHLRNAPKSRITGIELEASARLASSFRANLQVSVLNAEYRELQLNSGFQGLQDLKGKTQPFAPKLTLNGGLDWDVFTIAGGGVKFLPTVIYTSRVWYSPYNDLGGNQRLTQGPNIKANVQVSWTRDNYSIRLYGNNIFNRATYVYGLNLRDSFGYDYLVPGAPRTYGAAARYTF